MTWIPPTTTLHHLSSSTTELYTSTKHQNYSNNKTTTTTTKVKEPWNSVVHCSQSVINSGLHFLSINSLVDVWTTRKSTQVCKTRTARPKSTQVIASRKLALTSMVPTSIDMFVGPFDRHVQNRSNNPVERLKLIHITYYSPVLSALLKTWRIRQCKYSKHRIPQRNSCMYEKLEQ